MIIHILKKVRAAAVLFLAAHNYAVGASDEALLQPKTIVLDYSISKIQRNAQSLAARRYYTFWHTGDKRFAQEALDEHFIDLNLPQGRPQGPEGPLQASEHF